jgi:hypothetical protein
MCFGVQVKVQPESNRLSTYRNRSGVDFSHVSQLVDVFVEKNFQRQAGNFEQIWNLSVIGLIFAMLAGESIRR